MFGAGIRLLEDDDDFFGNLDNSQSNLANLFENSQAKSKLDHSLKYVPQKANTSDSSRKHDKNSGWNVEIAKVVTAYKLVNDENIPHGRVGMAVLKSPEGLQKIILYRAQNNILSTISLTDDIKIYLKDSYLQFIDDVKVFWSILFENGEQASILELIKHNAVIVEINADENKSKHEEPIVVDDTVELPPSTSTYPASIKEKNYSSDERSKDVKDTILTRISKMGQALPTVSTQHTDLSDSSDTEYKKRIPFSKPCILTRKPNKVQQIMTLATTIPNNSHIISRSNILPFNPQIVQQESQYLNMLLSENRTQNVEVRMNISKLETKIEKVLDKIELINNKSSDSSKDLEDDILLLEEKVLELKKENRNLKHQNQLNSQNTKNQGIVEQPKPSIYEKDLVEFGNLITSLGLDINNYQNSEQLCRDLIRNSTKEVMSLQTKLELQENILADTKTQLENQEKVKGQQLSDMNQQIEHLESKIVNLEILTETLRKDKENLFEKLESADKTVDDMVKTIMNTLYTNLVSKLVERQYSTNEVLKLCANEIKIQTKNALTERKK